MVLVTGIRLVRLSAPVLCFKGYYTDLFRQISLKLSGAHTGAHTSTIDAMWMHIKFTAMLTIERCTTFLPSRAHVRGLCAFRATSIPSPCSFVLRGGCSMICGYDGHHRSSRWSQHPVHHCTGTHPHLTPVKPPPTTANATHHCHIESLLPLQKIFLQWLVCATVEPTCCSFG
jgi:hypothetical protein